MESLLGARDWESVRNVMGAGCATPLKVRLSDAASKHLNFNQILCFGETGADGARFRAGIAGIEIRQKKGRRARGSRRPYWLVQPVHHSRPMVAIASRLILLSATGPHRHWFDTILGVLL
jgi:hypothetical protein